MDAAPLLPCIWHISVRRLHFLKLPYLLFQWRSDCQAELSAAMLSQFSSSLPYFFLEAFRASLHFFFWATASLLTRIKLTIESSFGDDHLSCGQQSQSFWASICTALHECSSCQIVRGLSHLLPYLPFYAKQFLYTAHIEMVKFLCVLAVHSPGFTGMQKSRKDNSCKKL